jgi:preprotein translocase subunit SecY
MRILMIFLAIIAYLFLLVYIESELVKIEVRKEELKNNVIALRNQKKQLESDLLDVANLANIENTAKELGYFFPEQHDILGVVE